MMSVGSANENEIVLGDRRSHHPCHHAGDGRLVHDGEDVVGAGGQRQQRHVGSELARLDLGRALDRTGERPGCGLDGTF